MARPLPLAITVQVSYADPSRAPRTLPFRIALSLSDTVQYVQRDDGRCPIILLTHTPMAPSARTLTHSVARHPWSRASTVPSG